MPGGEYERLPEDMRPYYVRTVPFLLQSSCLCQRDGPAAEAGRRLMRSRPRAGVLPPPPSQFLPFIQGPRNCLGQYFALLESRVILGVLAQRFTFTPVDAAKQARASPGRPGLRRRQQGCTCAYGSSFVPVLVHSLTSSSLPPPFPRPAGRDAPQRHPHHAAARYEDGHHLSCLRKSAGRRQVLSAPLRHRWGDGPR